MPAGRPVRPPAGILVFSVIIIQYMFLICLAGAALSLAASFLLKETLSGKKSSLRFTKLEYSALFAAGNTIICEPEKRASIWPNLIGSQRSVK